MVQSSQFKISGLLQPFLIPKPHNHWRPILGLSKPNLSETIRTTLQQWEWVTSIDFKDAYFLIPIQEQSRTYQISCPGSDIPVQSTVFWSVHCTHGAHCSSKGVETDGHTQEYNNPPVLRRLVGESHIPPGLSPAYTRSSENMPKFRLPVRPHGRSGPTYTGPLAEPSGQNTRKYCHYRFVRSSSSCLIGLLTATGKQFHLGRLHRRPIQWHLKNNWRVPESLEKVIPIPR